MCKAGKTCLQEEQTRLECNVLRVLLFCLHGDCAC